MTTNIDNLKRLLAEATPGPWEVKQGAVQSDAVGCVAMMATDCGDEIHPADLKLIVAAVNSLPAMLAELERLREALRLIIVTPLAIDDARDIARGALAESEAQ